MAKRRHVAEQHRPGAVDQAELRLISLEITTDPIEDDEMKRLSKADRYRVDEIAHELIYGEFGAEYVAELEALAERYPDVAKLRNFLMNAVEATGDHDRVQQMIREDAERFPDYLFAVTAYARLCLHDNRLDEAMGLFEKRMVLPDFYPNRTRFHITELLALHSVLTELFVRREEVAQAERHLEIIEMYEPDHPEVRRLRDLVELGQLRQAVRKMVGLARPSQRKRRKTAAIEAV